MNREELAQNKVIQTTIYLKVNQMKREALPTLKYEHLLEVMMSFAWKESVSYPLNQAVDDIMKIKVEDVVGKLHTLALMKGSMMSPDAIDEMMGGSNS